MGRPALPCEHKPSPSNQVSECFSHNIFIWGLFCAEDLIACPSRLLLSPKCSFLLFLINMLCSPETLLKCISGDHQQVSVCIVYNKGSERFQRGVICSSLMLLAPEERLPIPSLSIFTGLKCSVLEKISQNICQCSSISVFEASTKIKIYS